MELCRYVRKYIPDKREELVQVPQGESRPGRQEQEGTAGWSRGRGRKSWVMALTALTDLQCRLLPAFSDLLIFHLTRRFPSSPTPLKILGRLQGNFETPKAPASSPLVAEVPKRHYIPVGVTLSQSSG